jgi:hypothetical protein
METEPKFKFGQWVKEEGSMPFVISVIHKSSHEYLYSDGTMMPFSFESKLKLIERPKRKVKKRFYMMAYKSPADAYDWRVASYLVDDAFCNHEGIEMSAGFERKILENSPYIELEIETTEE